MLFSALRHAQGLYDIPHESDSCGVAMITDIQGRRTHAIDDGWLFALEHLEHRGAAGAETDSPPAPPRPARPRCRWPSRDVDQDYAQTS